MPTYKDLYIVIGIPLFVVSLLLPPLQVPYALIYFALTGWLVFSTEPAPEPDPTHSTVTHYEANSRLNWFNYAIAAILTVAALAFVFLPINKALSTFIIWSVTAFILDRLARRAYSELGPELVGHYLQEQNPDLSPEIVKSAVRYLNSHPKATATVLQKELGLKQQPAQRIHHLYHQYIEQNHLR